MTGVQTCALPISNNNSTSNVTTSAGALVGGAITAGTSLTIKGVSASNWGLQNSSAYTLTATNGDISLVGVGLNGTYQMGSLIASAGSIGISSVSTSSVWSYYAQSGSQVNYIALNDINIASYAVTYSSAINLSNILIRTTNGDIVLSARGGVTSNGSVSQVLYMAGVAVKAGRNFTIQIGRAHV